ncbi:hypothetical protein D9M71_827080 [compost metagenome]
MIWAFNIVHGEVREIDDAAIVAQSQMLGVGHAPKMAVIPFVLTHRDAVAIFFQQVLVGRITVRALPAAELHEMAT